ncbi:MAG: DNA-3-methyladenine glycosylase 2 family protein [Bacteroidota bacterium]|nr:DNA-3-methyladenine glycosylase 2 family protein [Candidatus Kapabacteria bacterium]MDW8219042.1 DNA-3-methyladenine glycosylase 2 family protein [Bacteroidota bacterium]
MSTAFRFHHAEQHIASVDPVMQRWIHRVGHCTLEPKGDIFLVLCDAIISQQISVKASAAILERFCMLFPNNAPTPNALLRMDNASLYTVGLSRAKVSYLYDAAARCMDGTVELNTLHMLDDETLMQTLMRIKGVGRWTAEMVMIFALNRLDVLSVGDLGLRKAMMQLYRLTVLPTPLEMLSIAELWRPYRTIGSWYLWKVVDTEPNRW